MTNLSSKKGTIANLFTLHQNDLFKYLQNSKQFADLHREIIYLLNDDSLKNNSQTAEAKVIFTKLYNAHNFNAYVSTLTTYMTGMKV